MSDPVEDWAPVAPVDDWTPIQKQPQTVPPSFIDRAQRGAAMTQAAGTGNPTPKDVIDSDWERLIEAGIVNDPYTGRPGAVHGAPLVTDKPTAWDQIKTALSSDVGRFIEGMKNMPMQAFEQAARHRAGADDTIDDVIGGALMGTGAGGEFLPGGVKFARPHAVGGRPMPQDIGTMPRDEDFANAAAAIARGMKLAREGDLDAGLRELWWDRGIHPAEAAHDAQSDAFLKHDLAAPPPGESANRVGDTNIGFGSKSMQTYRDIVRERDAAPDAGEALLDRLADRPSGYPARSAATPPAEAGPPRDGNYSTDAVVPNGLRSRAMQVYRDQMAARDAEVLDEGVAHSLGAASTEPKDLPPADVPFTKQPAPPAGRISAAVTAASDKLHDIGRDLQMLTAPMATGTRDSMALAKDFANSMRRNRWEWSRVDSDIAKRFTPEQDARMFNAMDEESVALQKGESREHQGIATLEPHERALVQDLDDRQQIAFAKARDLGMVQGDGIPMHATRMVLNIANATDKDAALSLDQIGSNLRVNSPYLRQRKHLTVEETEAAAKAKYGDQAVVARSMRAVALSTAKLEDAIAGRSLIENIKEYGKRTGSETVSEGAIPTGTDQKWFTLDHPAFRTWRPKFDGGKAVKDADGNVMFEQVPIHVHGDFEGPLRAVLTQRSGPLYSSMMELKGKTMSLIMNSPLIHNAVEWGRALPAMPGKVASFKIYFEGNRFKNDIPGMTEAIDNGLVPIGHRFFKQDITGIMEAPDLTPGRSWTAKIAAAVPGLFDEAAGTAVKRAIDKAGDFWHNTLLWDRVGDLQAGLYTNFQADLMAKGVDRTTASRAAAHFANRYAGALPKEAMSDGAAKIANMMLFSRSFTMGNLGVLKDMFTGLPKDVLAQIERDAGFKEGSINAAEAAPGAQEAVQYAKTIARRKAMAVVALDMGLFYVGNSILQNALNVMFNDSTLDREMHGYVERLQAKFKETREHPLSLLQPFHLMEGLGATGENEPGREGRILVGYAKDGTAIYARNPAGKIGEEFIGYMTGPLDMLRRKLGTLARPTWNVLANDKGFGRKVYDPEADTPAKYLKNLGLIAKHFAESQFPTGQMNAMADLVKGEGDSKVNALQAFGPIAGVTFSKGAPGGPAVGEYYHAKGMHDYAVQAGMDDIRRQIRRGDVTGAQAQMGQLGMDPSYQRWVIKTTQNPATRLSPKGMRDFYQYSTPEQRARMERLRSAPGPLAVQP